MTDFDARTLASNGLYHEELVAALQELRALAEVNFPRSGASDYSENYHKQLCIAQRALAELTTNVNSLLAQQQQTCELCANDFYSQGWRYQVVKIVSDYTYYDKRKSGALEDKYFTVLYNNNARHDLSKTYSVAGATPFISFIRNNITDIPGRYIMDVWEEFKTAKRIKVDELTFESLKPSVELHAGFDIIYKLHDDICPTGFVQALPGVL